MGRRRSQSPAEALFEAIIGLVAFLIYSITYLFYRLVLFIYDLVTFHTTKYKIKSGNGFLKTLLNKGHYGEFILYRKLVKRIVNEQVLANLYLDSENTELTEVDIVAVTQKGIYIFEMKNYGGYIYGTQKDQYWTQAMNRFSKRQFYNPLRQNYAHTKAMENLLGVDSSQLIPIVVFSNRSKLSKINVGSDDKVFQFKAALKFIKAHQKQSSQQFTKSEVVDIVAKLVTRTNMPEAVKQQHIESVQALKLSE